MTREFAVLGSPIAHSLSPVMHHAWFSHAKLDGQYRRIECASGLGALLRDHDELVGCSVTMPLKEEAFRLSTAHDVWAQRCGVVNTLVRTGSGWLGANTDAPSFLDLLEAQGVERVDRALVIGSGATARSAVAALAGVADSIEVLSRDRGRAEHCLSISPEAAWKPWESGIRAADLVVNTTPAGASDVLATAGEGLLIEVIYSPWPTPLAARWSGPVIDGLELLARQAARQVELFWPGASRHDAYPVMIAAARRAVG